MGVPVIEDVWNEYERAVMNSSRYYGNIYHYDGSELVEDKTKKSLELKEMIDKFIRNGGKIKIEG